MIKNSFFTGALFLLLTSTGAVQAEDPNPDVRYGRTFDQLWEVMVQMDGWVRDIRADSPLVTYSRDADPLLRAKAIGILGINPIFGSAAELLEQAVHDPDVLVRTHAVRGLRRIQRFYEFYPDERKRELDLKFAQQIRLAARIKTDDASDLCSEDLQDEIRRQREESAGYFERIIRDKTGYTLPQRVEAAFAYANLCGIRNPDLYWQFQSEVLETMNAGRKISDEDLLPASYPKEYDVFHNTRVVPRPYLEDFFERIPLTGDAASDRVKLERLMRADVSGRLVKGVIYRYLHEGKPVPAEHKALTDVFVKGLRHPNGDVSWACGRVLGSWHTEEALSAAAEAVKDPNPRVQHAGMCVYFTVALSGGFQTGTLEPWMVNDLLAGTMSEDLEVRELAKHVLKISKNADTDERIPKAIRRSRLRYGERVDHGFLPPEYFKKQRP